MSFRAILLAYVVGGVTFIPLLVAALLLHAYLTFPVIQDAGSASSDSAGSREDPLRRPGDDDEAFRSTISGLDERFLRKSSRDTDDAAGYFAVFREYVPRGVNGKPPERPSPVGPAMVAAESPSVYQ